MNSTIYLFGKFGHGITASVNDYTKNFFEEFISKANAPTQIIIHRDGDIMNYGYVRRIEKNHLFGICIQINGQYLSDIRNLFDTFENMVANCAVRGDILRLNKNGDLEASISSLQDKPEEVDRVIANCQSEILRISNNCKTLPTIDYSTTSSDCSHFKENDDNDRIITSSVKNGYTFIYKEQDFDTLALMGYRTTLSTLNKENKSYKDKVKELEHELKTLARKEKQMGVVLVLLAILFIGSIFFFTTIEEKNADIETKQETIDKQLVENSTLTEENRKIQNEKSNLQSQNQDLTIKQESTEQDLANLSSAYEALKRENVELKKENAALSQENSGYISEINSLSSQKSSLEWKLKNAEKSVTKGNKDYQDLCSKYYKVVDQLAKMEKKYYSTKEGRKEQGR